MILQHSKCSNLTLQILDSILMIPATTTRAAWLRLVCTISSSNTGRQSASTRALLQPSLARVMISGEEYTRTMHIVFEYTYMYMQVVIHRLAMVYILSLSGAVHSVIVIGWYIRIAIHMYQQDWLENVHVYM